MEFLQELSLELNSNSAYSTVGAKQGDNNSRIVIVHVTENGMDYNLRDNSVTSAYFRLRKPDGKAIINTANIDYDANTITIYLSAQALAVSGRGYADVTLMSGSSILSTISFILIIMASPQVAEQATSSNEFGYLNAVVEDATHIIYEAQAWAEGKKGSEDVYGEDNFISEKESEVITSLSVDPISFKQKVGERPGLKRIFNFVYNTNDIWQLVTTTYEGNTSTQSAPEVVSNLEDYNIILSYRSGANTPDPSDKIKITIEEADKTFENNAKYYAEQAELSRQAIEDLTVDVHVIDEDDKADVVKDSSSYPTKLSFYLPRGRTGEVNLLTFDLVLNDENIEDNGCLIMYTPERMNPIIEFTIENNQLYYEIMPRQAEG